MIRRRALAIALPCILMVLAALPFALAWRPAEHEPAGVYCAIRPPALLAGQVLKVMSWNIRFLSGDLSVNESERSTAAISSETLERNLATVVQTIREQEADVVLLQEVHDGASATGREDQLALLQARLSDLYPCRSEAFYRKASVVPFPGEFGSAGTKLAILSRFRLEHGARQQLPLAKQHPLRALFAFKPALQLVQLPIRRNGYITLINTQLDTGFAEQAQLQGEALQSTLAEHRNAGERLLLGGDLTSWRGNDEPAGIERIPSPAEVVGSDATRWLTFPAQDPQYSRSRFFHSAELKRLDAQVLTTAEAFAHRPLVVRLLLPPDGPPP